MNTPVSVIIPAWNLWDMTLLCLESLARHTEPGSIQIIVVDNGSTDATVTELQQAGTALFGQQFTAVRLPENQGFACGCNAGAETAAGEQLFFLNNDTQVTENWLPPLRAALESPFVGMAGPLLLLPGSHRVQHCGIVFAPTLEVAHLYAFFPGNHPLVRKSRVVQALTGAAFLLPTRLFHQCGGFHQGYVNGFEDLDLCCSVRRQGLRLVSVPQSVIFHLTSQTPGRFDHDAPNTRLLNHRWPDGFIPDLHRLGLEDGFVPVLSPALELYLALPKEHEDARTHAFTLQFDEDRCRRRLHAEPLWQGGYTLLARHLENQARWADACDVRATLVRFFPLPEHAAALARTAARASDTALAEQAGQAARDLLRTAADVPALIQKAQALAQWGQDRGDADLAGLYQGWLNPYRAISSTSPRPRLGT